MKKRKKVERTKTIKKVRTVEEYINWQIQKGYIKEDGTPLKCKCGCRKFKRGKEYYDEIWGGYYVVEYAELCKSCGRTVGYWAYGNWELY